MCVGVRAKHKTNLTITSETKAEFMWLNYTICQNYWLVDYCLRWHEKKEKGWSTHRRNCILKTLFFCTFIFKLACLFHMFECIRRSFMSISIQFCNKTCNMLWRFFSKSALCFSSWMSINVSLFFFLFFLFDLVCVFLIWVALLLCYYHFENVYEFFTFGTCD